MKRILIVLIGCSIFFACAKNSSKEDKKHIISPTGNDSKKIENSSREGRYKSPFASSAKGLHPFFEIENVHPITGDKLKVGGMTFWKGDLYVVTLNPNRTNSLVDRKGKLYKVSGLLTAKSRKDVKVRLLYDRLYEPVGIAVVVGKIYIGEKHRIIRLDDKNNDGVFTDKEITPLVTGLSIENFHTYTVGFEKILRNNKLFLVGNFTTTIRSGGSRLPNTQKNKKVKRGSTFTLGPITGKETAQSIRLDYIAGGYRTPNGIYVDNNSDIYVTDNEGIFNPVHKFLKLKQGSFYGHFLEKVKGSTLTAFQPEVLDTIAGAPGLQTPATVYIPKSIKSTKIARSPSQPVNISKLKGEAAVYNGQFFVPDLTTGTLFRVSLEEINGHTQGVLFRHSSGASNKNGEDGFFAGPNRIIQGKDNHYYIGGIGAGRLWQFYNDYGLQRLKLKEKLPQNFNEIVNVKLVKNGFELEFLRDISDIEFNEKSFVVKQWTYIPSFRYGGAPVGEHKIKITKVELKSPKKILISIEKINDVYTTPYIQRKIGNTIYNNKNVGWIFNLEIKSEFVKKYHIWTKEFWYTVVESYQDKQKNIVKPTITESLDSGKKIYESLCMSCHTLNGKRLVGPSLKKLYGRKQTVIRGKKSLIVTVDEKYLDRALNNPSYEYPKGYSPAMPNFHLSKKKRNLLIDFIKKQ